ncbi:MAG: NAD(P)/FAD-dependent oxidoreductase [Methylococcaceae bacterium]|nr:MAG: NAD(P)/FAD-dependent oxidoreductase [Methylococcaceae bacterium]
MSDKEHYQVIVIGGGAAGMFAAASLLRSGSVTDLAIIEPSETHYYQAAWTLVGGGIMQREDTAKPTVGLIPPGATWIRDSVVSLAPDDNRVTVKGGKTYSYDYLVVAPGIQINWGQIKGLPEAMGKNGVCSNYSYDTVNSTWETIQNFTGGTALFTFPATPIKCPGAAQKIMYLAEEHFRKQGLRDKTQVIYMCAGPGIFAVKKYAAALLKYVVGPRQIETRFKHNLIEIRGEEKEAVFVNLETQEPITVKYDMIHVTPPMGPPDFIKGSPLANESGWVDVNKQTLQHVRYPNVFSLGDASSLPTSKTAAAVRAEGPVLVENLLAVMKKQNPGASYDGYTSCPLVTGRGKLILAEFDYDLNPKETFPFDQAKERLSMYLLKRYILPIIYWKGLLKGRRWPLEGD